MEIYIAAGILILVGAVLGYAVRSVKDRWFYKLVRKESSRRFAAEQKYREDVRLWWFAQINKIWEQWLRKIKLTHRIPDPKYIPASKTPRGGTNSKIPTGRPSFFECTHPTEFTAKDICKSFEEGYSGGFESGLSRANEITEVYLKALTAMRSFLERFIGAAKQSRAEADKSGTCGKVKIADLVEEAEKILKELKE